MGHGNRPGRAGMGFKELKSCILTLLQPFCRLQQPVQNPISDKTNILWNSPSLGKNYSYRLPLVL